MEENLNDYIEEFYLVKSEADKYKKLADEDNKKIKELMQNKDLTEFETENGLQAKIIIQKRENFDEDKLIQKLCELGPDAMEAIKTKQYVDMDILEDLIYNNYVNAAELTDCKNVKKVITLKVNKNKGE